MADTVRAALDRANPFTLADHLRTVHLGRVLAGHVNQQLHEKDPAPSANELATLEAVGLDESSRAAFVDRAVVIAGGVTGELSVQAYGATPSTGQVAVSPSGDVVVLASDLITKLDLYYRPVAGDVFEATLPAPAGVMTLPAPVSGHALLLLEAEATAVDSGGIAGRKIVLVPATAVVATTKAALSVDRTKVYFNTATDKVTQARVRLLVSPRLLGLAEALASEPQTV